MKASRSEAVYLPNRLKFVVLRDPPPTHTPGAHYFSIDELLIYWNFFLDFGPLNLGQMYRFCALLNGKLNAPEHQGKVLYFYASAHPHRRTNAAVLIACWSIIYLGWTPEQAHAPLRQLNVSFALFHDASPCQCTFEVKVLDCLEAVHLALRHRFFNYETFDAAEYEHYEAVEHGDLNWLVDGKFLAFAGPHDKRSNQDGYPTLTPGDYCPYFRQKNVSLVVRLNKPYYDKRTFLDNGCDFVDLYYLDGSNPPMRILNKFLQMAEATPGAVAVHCKAGLGRTGTCIGAYLMKHYEFTAEQIIAWMRICRPGSVIGPQQQFMAELQPALWQQGLLHRQSLVDAARRTSAGASARDDEEETPRRSRRLLQGHAPGESLASTMGSLALAGARSLDGGHSDKHEPSQGDLLRTRRAANSPCGKF
ncbi:dual specificity protein phosphatase [Pelagophyceae sp. CCMP2097]|nr:dual specificity protein phosphatase [Pelagophyceae sp. CCMP2097]|mmetsp:Transcript_22602/g.76363  ORF Transcript_22602/g.76363 Transcript_22602/m.76363 type:complete len:420 (+) Transcript_22602:119-1378(+)